MDLSKRKSLKQRWRKVWNQIRWYLLGFSWIITITLGVVGYHRYHQLRDNEQPVLNELYQSFQLVVLESESFSGQLPFSLELARWLAPSLVAYTAIQAIAVVFSEQFNRFRLRYYKEHVIVCGLGERGYQIIKSFIANGENVVVIEKDAQNDLLEPAGDMGATILLGDAAISEMLLLAGVQRARYLVTVNGQDSTNAEIAMRARELVSDPQNTRSFPLTCLVHIEDPRLCDLLHDYEKVNAVFDKFQMIFFNIYDLGAQAVIQLFPPFQSKYPTESNSHPHILIVGLGSMGRSLLVRCVRRWLDLNHTHDDPQFKPLHFTVVDREARHKVETLKLRYPILDSLCTIDTIQIDIRWPEFQSGNFLFYENGEVKVSIVYICIDNDSLGISAGLTINQRLRIFQIPVIIRTTSETGISGLWDQKVGSNQTDLVIPEGFENLHAFGLIERTCQPEILLGSSPETIFDLVKDI